MFQPVDLRRPSFDLIIVIAMLVAFTAPTAPFLAVALLHPLLLPEVHRLATSDVATTLRRPVLLIDHGHGHGRDLTIHGTPLRRFNPANRTLPAP